MSDEKKPIGRIRLKRSLAPELRDGDDSAAEADALRALAERFGVPGIDLHQVTIPMECLALVPREVAESLLVLPVLARDDRLFIAIADPGNSRVIDELQFVTGRRVYAYVAAAHTLEMTIRMAYDAMEKGEESFAGRNAPKAALSRSDVEPASSARGNALPARPPSILPDKPREDVAEAYEFSTDDFGSLDAEISNVIPLTDEFRKAAGLGPAPEGGTGKRILLIDDEADIRHFVRRLLVDKGHQVIEADRGFLALRLMKEQPPDLIVLDAMLPEVHGFDIAKRIKGSEKYGTTPVLMMSAVYRGWRIAEDLKANYGIEDYIEKPFRIAELLAKVARLLDRDPKGAQSSDPERSNQDVATHLAEGIAAYKAGDIDGAVTLLKKGISIDPLAYRLRYHLALIYGKQGLIYDGIMELERAIDLNPKHFSALRNLAVLYEKAGFRNKGSEMWERCIQATPDPQTRASIKAHLIDLL